MHKQPHSTRHSAIALGLIGALALGVGFFNSSTHAVQNDAGDQMVIGTYDPQSAFEQYPARDDMMQQIQQGQQKMQEAQQQGDQQALIQLQQELEKLQQDTIASFYDDVKEALPQIAENQGIKVIAMEVVYTSDDVKSSDVTEQIVKSFD